MMFDLACEPGGGDGANTDDDDRLLTIRGRIRGTSSPGSVYRAWVSFDRNSEEFDDGACTCPAYTGYRYEVCKHMAALVFHFADHPDLFRGFGQSHAAGSSVDLLDYMERLDELESRRREAKRNALLRATGVDAGHADAAHTAVFGSPRSAARVPAPLAMVGPGQVSLEPTVALRNRVWSVSFRILNLANASSYVLKSVSRFVLDMDRGEFEQYGQKLAFTHTPDMLDGYGRAVLRFMRRAVEARRNALMASHAYMPVNVERDLILSEDELAQLLRISEGRRLDLIYERWMRSTPERVAVDGVERPIRITMRRAKQGATEGYALRGDVCIDEIIEGAERSYMLVGPGPAAVAGAATGSGSSDGEDSPAAAARALSAMSVREIADLPDSELSRLGLLGMGGMGGMGGTGGISGPDGSASGAGAGYGEGRRFCRFPEDCEPLRPILTTLCDGDPDGRFVSDDDLPLFARTLLPLLERAGVDGDVPEPVRELKPQPAEPEFYLDRTEDGVTCTLKVRYGAREVGVLPSVPGDRGGLRDLAAERAALAVVRRYFAVSDSRRPAVIDRDETYAVVRLFDEGLKALHAAGAVFTTPAFDRLLAPRPPKARLAVVMNGGLVDVSLLADEVPPDEVGALLASYRRRQRFHRLKDGTLVPLGEHDAGLDAALATARDLGLADDAFEKGDGTVEVPGFQAFMLDAAVDDADKDDGFRAFVGDVKVIDPSRYAVPKSLAGVLRPYQADGFRWLMTLCDKGFGGILADEMGLGKSVQFIAMLLARREASEREAADGAGRGPSLIVCPASLVYNWAAEFAKFAPSLAVETVAGPKAQRKALLDGLRDGSGDGGRASRPDVLITSYDLLRLDAAEYRGLAFDAMAIDEAQVIKNHTTKVARAVKSIDARHRFALTGTPVENRLAELWSIFDFLMPGLLGTFKRFHERYEMPIANDAYGDEGRAQAAKLKALTGVFILRRLKSQVLTDLPDKLENVVTVRLEGEQRRLYAAHEQRLRLLLTHEDARDFNAERIRILAELTKLRQICCDPRLLYANAKDRSAKLAAIEELVDTCVSEGKKALVFSQFTSFLELIAARLKARGTAYYTITGETPKKRRVELVDRFNGDDVPVFLISLKAGNTGLNLTGASVVIHADPWWNAAAQDQATDRAHRIGQTRDVNVYQIVAKDTIEERMLKLQAAKSEVARQVLGDGSAAGGVAALTRDDLLGLLNA
ncbi:helicase [Bifidobacterium avesanii]|uniref:Helicase n=2 Tax=Bifidobacterium avesanii TaxID=1798157 RepID=A0A7K3TJJ4_9BIFI|nr:helicase [Bifidobacterium avesanii]